MEASHTQAEKLSATEIPLLGQQEDQNDTRLCYSLHRLETFLRLFGFCQYSALSSSVSWLSFLLLGIALPLSAIELSFCSDCEKYEIKSFELEILISQSLVAAISLLCIAHNLRKHGVRKFLFVDRQHGYTAQFREEYVQKINGFFQLLAIWLFPCLFVKTAREVGRVIYEHHHSWWLSVTILIASLVSWTYLNAIYLSGSALFNLVCNLQVIHLENFGKLLETDADVAVYIEEHINLTHNLSTISHRFRAYLLLELLVVTASEFMALLQTTGNRKLINFINASDSTVSSIVQLVGIVFCLHGATKISNRAQGLASVASRWHALITCSSNENSQSGITSSGGNLKNKYPGSSIRRNYSESDMETADYVPVPTDTQLASYMSAYHKRQAFVTYMQSNPGGATVFGWRIDRALISTIFFLQFSLVLFVLGKTITFTTT